MTLFILAVGSIFIVSIWCLYRQFSYSGKRSDIVFGAGMAIALPVLSLLVYFMIGTPAALYPQQLNASDAMSQLGENNTLGIAQLQKAITTLEAETQENPDDVEKLSMLANSYTLSRRFADAASTWNKILRLDNSIDTLLSAADAHTAANGGAINNTAQQLIMQALERAPQHPQALWLAGMSAVQQGQLAIGKRYWQALHTQLANVPQQQQELSSLIQQIDSELARSENNKQNDTQSNTQNNTQNNSTASNASESTLQTTANSASIKVTVSLSATAQATASSTDTVFVFAKAANGPPAPLAVKRLTVGDLPTTIELTEQDAMMPQMTIAQFADIKLSAKVSKSGNPSDRAGDIRSNELPINQANADAAQSHQLVIGD